MIFGAPGPRSIETNLAPKTRGIRRKTKSDKGMPKEGHDVSGIAKIGQRVEAARQTLHQIEQQHSKYNEDLASLLEEVAECVNRKRAEMMESKAEYERIIDEYAQLKDLLHSPLPTSIAGHGDCLGDIIRDLDAEVVDLESTRAVNGKFVDHASIPDENIAEIDPDRVRLGLHRALNNKRNHVPIAAQAEKVAT